ncbi:Immunoglobulin A1 protease, partial [Bienertia sinuspersici]
LESQHKHSAYGGSKFSKPDFNVASSSKESDLDQENKSDVLKTLKNKLTIGNSKEEASKKPDCFKCQGLGHVSKVCPNRTMVTRQEYYNFLMQNMDELVEQEQELVQQALMQDVAASDFWEKQPKCGPEYSDSILVLRRSLLADPQDDPKDLQRTNLFHSQCLVRDKVCSFIIDSGSCTNACSLTMVDKL